MGNPIKITGLNSDLVGFVAKIHKSACNPDAIGRGIGRYMWYKQAGNLSTLSCSAWYYVGAMQSGMICNTPDSSAVVALQSCDMAVPLV